MKKTIVDIYMGNEQKISLTTSSRHELTIFKKELYNDSEIMTINEDYTIFKKHIAFVSYVKEIKK